MNLEVFTLCDAATDQMGKLNILGSFDRLNVRALPATHPACTLAIRLRFDRSESGEHLIKVNLIDEDGQPVIDGLEGKAAVQVPDQVPSQAVNMVINFHQLKFEKFGDYAIDLRVDEQLLGSLPLYVRNIPWPG